MYMHLGFVTAHRDGLKKFHPSDMLLDVLMEPTPNIFLGLLVTPEIVGLRGFAPKNNLRFW
jgi:hypothetical protein